MGLRLWWWHKVRRVDIAPELEERFEFYGETLLTLASVTEPNSNALGVELAGLSRMKRQEMAAWLQERRDIAAQHEDRLETVEWAILIFVVAGVVLDVVRLWIGR
jgi:hypothetical protein